MEAFPIKFCKNIRSHWTRRRYHKLDISDSKKIPRKSITLRGNRRRVLLLRRRPVLKTDVLKPIRLLARLRDRYMDMMIGMTEKSANKFCGSVTASDVYWERSMSKKRPVKMDQREFESKLVLEIYKSFATSRGIYTDV